MNIFRVFLNLVWLVDQKARKFNSPQKAPREVIRLFIWAYIFLDDDVWRIFLRKWKRGSSGKCVRGCSVSGSQYIQEWWTYASIHPTAVQGGQRFVIIRPLPNTQLAGRCIRRQDLEKHHLVNPSTPVKSPSVVNNLSGSIAEVLVIQRMVLEVTVPIPACQIETQKKKVVKYKYSHLFSMYS